jgi:hypothetical protein
LEYLEPPSLSLNHYDGFFGLTYFAYLDVTIFEVGWSVACPFPLNSAKLEQG